MSNLLCAKSDEYTKDSVSKTNKGYFFTFYLKYYPDLSPAILLTFHLFFLLKTVFYKKHPIDEAEKWPYHHLNIDHSSCVNGVRVTLKKRGKKCPFYQYLSPKSQSTYFMLAAKSPMMTCPVRHLAGFQKTPESKGLFAIVSQSR